MAITIPALKDLLSLKLAALLALEPTMSVSLDTLEGARLYALAQAVYGLYCELRGLEADFFCEVTISTTALEKHAEVRLGPDARKPAVKSSGTDALRVAGTVGATVAASDTLIHTDGTRYQLTEGATVGAGGTVDVSVESISLGAAVNKLTGDTLSFESPPAGITTEAALVVDLTGGVDQESNAELLERVLAAYRSPPAGGRASDYKAWAMEMPGVAKAYVYCPSSTAPNGRRGMGTTDVAILCAGSGSSRIPSATLVQEVQDHIDELRPCTTSDSTVLTPASDSQDVDVKITPLTGYEWDWTGTAGEVSSYAAKVVTWVAALPDSLKSAVDAKGSARIYVAGQVLTVLSYNSGAKQTTVSETPSPVPASPDVIYPAGPVSSPVRAAILAQFDGLGPARGSAPDPNQIWEDTLRLSKLYASAVYQAYEGGASSGVAGVGEMAIVTPASTVTPTDHAPSGTIDFLVPGRVTVRPV